MIQDAGGERNGGSSPCCVRWATVLQRNETASMRAGYDPAIPWTRAYLDRRFAASAALTPFSQATAPWVRRHAAPQVCT
jgi:hypothetical protein